MTGTTDIAVYNKDEIDRSSPTITKDTKILDMRIMALMCISAFIILDGYTLYHLRKQGD